MADDRRSRSPDDNPPVYRIRDGVRHEGPVPDPDEALMYEEDGVSTLLAATQPRHERGSRQGLPNYRAPDWYETDDHGRDWFGDWLDPQRTGRLRSAPRPLIAGAPFYDPDIDGVVCGDCKKELMIFNEGDVHGDRSCVECGKNQEEVSERNLGATFCLCVCTCTPDELSVTVPGLLDEDFELTGRDNIPANDHRHERHERSEGGTLVVGLAESEPPGNIYYASSEDSPNDPISVEEILSLGLPLGIYDYESLRLAGHTEAEIREAFPEVNNFYPKSKSPTPASRCKKCRLQVPDELTSEATLGKSTKIGYDMCLRCFKPVRSTQNVHDTQVLNTARAVHRCECRCECSDKSLLVDSSSSSSGSNPPPASKRAYGIRRGDTRLPLRPLSYYASMGMLRVRQNFRGYLEHCRANPEEVAHLRQSIANGPTADSLHTASALHDLEDGVHQDKFVRHFVQWVAANRCLTTHSEDRVLRAVLVFLITSTNRDIKVVEQEAITDEVLLGDLMTAWIELEERSKRLQIHLNVPRWIATAKATGKGDRQEFRQMWLTELRVKRYISDLEAEIHTTLERMKERERLQRKARMPRPHKFQQPGRPLLYVPARDGRVAYVPWRNARWLRPGFTTDPKIVGKTIRASARQALNRAEAHFEELNLPVGYITERIRDDWERDNFPQYEEPVPELINSDAETELIDEEPHTPPGFRDYVAAQFQQRGLAPPQLVPVADFANAPPDTDYVVHYQIPPPNANPYQPPAGIVALNIPNDFPPPNAVPQPAAPAYMGNYVVHPPNPAPLQQQSIVNPPNILPQQQYIANPPNLGPQQPYIVNNNPITFTQNNPNHQPGAPGYAETLGEYAPDPARLQSPPIAPPYRFPTPSNTAIPPNPLATFNHTLIPPTPNPFAILRPLDLLPPLLPQPITINPYINPPNPFANLLVPTGNPVYPYAPLPQQFPSTRSLVFGPQGIGVQLAEQQRLQNRQNIGAQLAEQQRQQNRLNMRNMRRAEQARDDVGRRQREERFAVLVRQAEDVFGRGDQGGDGNAGVQQQQRQQQRQQGDGTGDEDEDMYM